MECLPWMGPDLFIQKEVTSLGRGSQGKSFSRVSRTFTSPSFIIIKLKALL